MQGLLEGADSGAVAGQLTVTGITPIDITPSATRLEIGPGLFERLREQKIRHTDILLFCRHMYTLLRAGVPIMGALKGLEESSENKAMSQMVRELRTSLDSGHELSVSLARRPEIFNPFYIAMVRVGELTGTLEEVFLRLFNHMEFEKFMRDQVRAAVRYPAFVVGTMAIAIVIINIFVIPAFAKVYQGFKAELPAITKALIAFSDFMVATWPVLLVALVALVFAARGYVRTARGRMAWDELKLRIPIAGTILLKATLARFARSLALSMRSGVPVVQGLTTVAGVVDNAYLASRIEQMREGVERGESILRTAAATGVFTPVVLQMIAVGDEAGELDDLMMEVAGLYEREVDYSVKTLAAQIEPILIVFLGVIVLILALGVFLPIWDLSRVAFKR